ncbi:MAG: WD40 repeat domain-containing protein, partial [Verrucomicrobiota bacterium]
GTKTRIAPLSGHDSRPTPLAFSPDGATLASGGNDGTVKLWDVARQRDAGSLIGHQNVVATGAFSPDGKILATGSFDHTIKLWDVSTRVQLTTFRGHLGEVYSVAFAPNGKILASASADGTIKFWDPAPKRAETTFKKFPSDLKIWSLSPDGQWLFLVFADHSFSRGDLRMRPWQESERLPLGSTNIMATTLLPGGHVAALGTVEGKVRLVDASTLREIVELSGFERPVSKLACSADGKILVAESIDHRIKAWDIATKREVANFTIRDRIESDRLPLSPDGAVLVTPFLDGITEIWDLTRQRTMTTLTNERLYVMGAAFFRDGKRVAICSFDRTAKIWDIAAQRASATMFSDQTGLRSIALAPNERRLAAGDDLGQVKKVKVWDLASEQEVAVLPGHKEAIIDVAFWPDGNTIVSVSKDAVFLWRAPSFADIEAEEQRQAAARPFGVVSP